MAPNYNPTPANPALTPIFILNTTK